MLQKYQKIFIIIFRKLNPTQKIKKNLLINILKEEEKEREINSS